MSEKENFSNQEIHSKVLRAGRRTYFFDVRSTKADDYYLTITESKKHTDHNGKSFYKKHKIYLYKEDFDNFKEYLEEITDFIIRERGEEVISDTHQPHFEKNDQPADNHHADERDSETNETAAARNYTDVSFDDI